MSDPNPPEVGPSMTAEDAEVADVLDAYLRSVESGQPLEVAQLIAEHPNIADRLRNCLSSLTAFNAVSPQIVWNDGPNATAPLPRLTDYEIIKEIGRGGMGVVYEAEQKSLRRRVALKILPLAAMLDAKHLQRFKNEALITAQLKHPHIVGVHAIGEERGLHYYAMEFINGYSLKELIADLRSTRDNCAPCDSGLVTRNAKTLDVTEVDQINSLKSLMAGMETFSNRKNTTRRLISLPYWHSDHYFQVVARIGHQVADALHYAHSCGILHRDIKPSNIMLDSHGDAHVTDFGLARMQAEQNLTRSGQMVGTLRYMSPEQAGGRTEFVDHRTDIYSLGSTLYEMITLRPLLTGDQAADVIKQREAATIPTIRKFNPGTPADLETIVIKSVEQTREDRYESAHELANDLRRFLDDQPIHAKRPSLRQRLSRWSRRNRLFVGVCAGLLVLTILSALVLTWRESRWNALALEQTRASERRELIAREAAERALYLESVARAAVELENNNISRADRALETSDTRFRDFEWNFLKRLCHAERLILQGHKGTVESVDFSPDGRQLVSAGADKQVLIWDLASGQCIHRSSMNATVTCARFHPSGKHLAIASGSWTDHQPAVVRITDLDGTTLHSLSGNRHAVTDLQFSPDRQHVATAGWDGSVRIWDSNTGEEHKVLHGQHGSIKEIAFLPSGQSLVATGVDGTIHFWDLQDGTESFSLPVHGDVNRVAISPSGDSVIAGTFEGRVTGWNLQKLSIGFAAELNEGPIGDLDYSPDGTQIAVATDRGAIHILESRTGRRTRVIHAHDGRVFSIAFHPSGKWLASSHDDGTIKLWDLGQQEYKSFNFVHRGTPRGIVFDPAGEYIIRAGWYHTGATVGLGRLNTLTWEIEEPICSRPQGFLCVDGSRDGKILAVGTEVGIEIWDVHTRNKLITLDTDADQRVTDVAFSMDGRRLASSSQKGSVTFWSVEAGSRLAVHPGHEQAVSALAVDNRSGLLASGGKDGRVVLWDMAEAAQVRELVKRSSAILSLAFSPLDTRLVTAQEDGVIRSWDIETGALLHEMEGHGNAVLDVAYSPSGTRLASVGQDNTMRIWDTESGQEVLSIRRMLRKPCAVAFDHTGRWLAVSNNGRALAVWDLTGERIREPLTVEELTTSSVDPRGGIDWPAKIVKYANFAGLSGDKLDVSDPATLHTMAQALNFARPEDRNPEDALSLAQQAVARLPRMAAPLRTLGIAHFRAGDPQAALDVFARADSLPNDAGSGSALLVSALCHHQLDNPEAAIQSLQQAQRWYRLRRLFPFWQSVRDSLLTECRQVRSIDDAILNPDQFSTTTRRQDGRALNSISSVNSKHSRFLQKPIPWNESSTNDSRLFWKATQPGQRLTLRYHVDAAGSYGLTCLLTRSFDYGIVQLLVNREPIGKPVDLFALNTIAALEFDFGNVSLLSGENVIEFEITDKNDRSTGYYFGIEAVIIE